MKNKKKFKSKIRHGYSPEQLRDSMENKLRSKKIPSKKKYRRHEQGKIFP